MRDTNDTMAHREDRHHPREEENVLHLIAEKERELEQVVQRAREEAAALLESARKQADEIKRRAREDAAALAAEYARRAEQESQRIAADVVARARREAETLRARAAEHMDEAVRFVVERVLGGAANR